MSRTEIAPGKSLESLSKGGVEFESLYDKLVALANNLWWSWHPEVVELYRDLDPIRWRQLDHNPIALLRNSRPSGSTPVPTSWCCTAASTRHFAA